MGTDQARWWLPVAASYTLPASRGRQQGQAAGAGSRGRQQGQAAGAGSRVTFPRAQAVAAQPLRRREQLQPW
jgi:hypothetical protein